MKIEVSGAIASKNGVTLFTPEGTSKVYGQDSWRTGDLLKAVLIPLANAGGQPITVELDDYSLADRIKQVTGGTVEAKEVITNGVSSVALSVGGKTIDDTAALSAQIERALYEGSPGLGAFLERYAKVEHMQTAAEVLKFMEKLDLPLADDGCMILYKFLDAAPGKPGYYVDHHTRKVMQRVGSRVYMELKDYAKTRSECATGLHVCSKHYGQYGGQVLIVKVRPEDVVAIPDHYNGKMRVLAYHIVAKLDDVSHTAVASKQSALTAKGAKGIIAEVIAGQHIGVIEEVLVGAHGQHTVKVLATPEVSAPRNLVRKIAEKPALIDPKQVRDAINASKVGIEVGQQVDMEGTPVFIREIDGRKALVATRLAHGHGSWVSLVRLSPLKAVEKSVPAPVVEAPSPAPAPEPTGTEPWQLAKPQQWVRIEGSKKIPDGSYQVATTRDDGKASRLVIRTKEFGDYGVANTLVKAITGQPKVTPEKAASPSKSEAPVDQLTGKEQKKQIEAAPRIKQGRQAEKPVQTLTPEYRAKLDKAQEMLNAGATLRQIDKALSMCRKSLARHIALGNLKAV